MTIPTLTGKRAHGTYDLQARMENYLLGKLSDLKEGLDDCARHVDVETLHKLRVTSRRLRVGLRLFGDLFPGRELRQSCRQVKRLTRALGTVRALDVDLLILKGMRRKLPEQTREAQVRTARMLLVDRAEAVKEVEETVALLRKSGFVAQLERMVRYAHRRLDSKRLMKSVREEVERLRKVARCREERWREKGSGRAFHRLRIAVKKYRYALEAAGAVFESRVQTRLGALKELQDAMGACHDLEILLEWLASAKFGKPLSRQVEWICGSLSEDGDQRRSAAGKLLKENRHWMKKMRLELKHE
jgi:CHAD domain-containing protein